ncbi:TetR/AcrR family transcriptional regulator [Kitasatospora sp. NPDC050543]|uniref:TetR/AcrR family transcriptional regulator n=1 Tax=Kitasatospora sp. NPDC050543 TaxID=3364054 RepID=UPI0037B27B87
MEQERLLGRAGSSRADQGGVPEQRVPAGTPGYEGVSYAYREGLRQEQAWPEPGGGPDPVRQEPAWPEPVRQGAPPREPARQESAQGGGRTVEDPGTPPAGTRLRVDARRNLESVLRAAREVFGEFGYGAPMEEVARRAGVGVGTVYRRFPSKEVLVRRIAAEEVGWLTAQARESLYGDAGPWEALAGYLARAVGTGAGRLLPPEAFRYAADIGRVPEQRGLEARPAGSVVGAGSGAGSVGDPAEPGDADPRPLLQLLAALVARAGAAGELRPGVTVSDVVLVLTASVPVHATRGAAGSGTQPRPGAGQLTGDQADADRYAMPATGRTGAGRPPAAPADRLLEILLDGLRAR